MYYIENSHADSFQKPLNNIKPLNPQKSQHSAFLNMAGTKILKTPKNRSTRQQNIQHCSPTVIILKPLKKQDLNQSQQATNRQVSLPKIKQVSTAFNKNQIISNLLHEKSKNKYTGIVHHIQDMSINRSNVSILSKGLLRSEEQSTKGKEKKKSNNKNTGKCLSSNQDELKTRKLKGTMINLSQKLNKLFEKSGVKWEGRDRMVQPVEFQEKLSTRLREEVFKKMLRHVHTETLDKWQETTLRNDDQEQHEHKPKQPIIHTYGYTENTNTLNSKSDGKLNPQHRAYDQLITQQIIPHDKPNNDNINKDIKIIEKRNQSSHRMEHQKTKTKVSTQRADQQTVAHKRRLFGDKSHYGAWQTDQNKQEEINGYIQKHGFPAF